MSNKTYDRLKLIALIGIPVCSTAAGVFAKLDYGWAPVASMIFGAVGTALGLILKNLSDNYHTQEEG